MADQQGIELPPINAQQIIDRLEQLDENLYYRIVNEIRVGQLAGMVEQLSAPPETSAREGTDDAEA